MADNILIIEFNKGTGRAFSAVYERLYPGIYYFAKKFVVAEDAADIAADVFFKLFESKKRFESFDNIKAWLIICVRNACLNKLAGQKYRHVAHKEIAYQLAHENPDWQDETEQREIRNAYLKRIYAAVDDLSEQKRTIFRMAFIEGLKNPEIAEKLGVSERQIRNIKSRLLLFLREALKEKGVAAALFVCFLDS